MDMVRGRTRRSRTSPPTAAATTPSSRGRSNPTTRRWAASRPGATETATTRRPPSPGTWSDDWTVREPRTCIRSSVGASASRARRPISAPRRSAVSTSTTSGRSDRAGSPWAACGPARPAIRGQRHGLGHDGGERGLSAGTLLPQRTHDLPTIRDAGFVPAQRDNDYRAPPLGPKDLDVEDWSKPGPSSPPADPRRRGFCGSHYGTTSGDASRGSTIEGD